MAHTWFSCSRGTTPGGTARTCPGCRRSCERTMASGREGVGRVAALGAATGGPGSRTSLLASVTTCVDHGRSGKIPIVPQDRP